MVGTRQLERVLSHAAEAGAKVVLVGDTRQLQSIEAGAAFRSIHERHGGAEIGEVRRQREDWQRDATRDLATGRTGDALQAYRSHGMVHAAQTREQARDDLIDRWDRDRQAAPDAQPDHPHPHQRRGARPQRGRARADAGRGRSRRGRAPDGRARRAKLRQRGSRHVPAERARAWRQERHARDHRTGQRAIHVGAHRRRPESVAFDLKDYNKIDHGYAATIHKAQGMTVDRAHVLATPGMDAHGSYVALSRHRDGVDLHYGRDDFASQDRLTRTLSRDRSKDMASDYERADPAQNYAERRGITFRERVAEIVRKVVPEKVRDMFDGLRPSAEAVPGPDGARRPEREAPERKVAEDPEAALRKARTKALVRHARAVDAIFDVQERGGKASPEQVKELQEARKVFEEVRPYGSHDAEAAYKKNPELVREAAGGQVNRAIRALQLETELRTDPSRRADRFVERWQKLDQSQPASVSGGRHVRLQGHALGDGRHGQKPANAIRSLNPCSPTASANSASAAISAQAAGWATNSPSHTVSTWAEAAASDSEPADLPPPLRHSAMPRRTLLHAPECLSCLVPAAVRNSQQEAGQPCENQTVSSA